MDISNVIELKPELSSQNKDINRYRAFGSTKVIKLSEKEEYYAAKYFRTLPEVIRKAERKAMIRNIRKCAKQEMAISKSVDTHNFFTKQRAEIVQKNMRLEYFAYKYLIGNLGYKIDTSKYSKDNDGICWFLIRLEDSICEKQPYRSIELIRTVCKNLMLRFKR